MNTTKHFVDSVSGHVVVAGAILSAIFVVFRFFINYLNYTVQKGKFYYWGLPDTYISSDELNFYNGIYFTVLAVVLLGIYYLNHLFFRTLFKTGRPGGMKIISYIKQLEIRGIMKGLQRRIKMFSLLYVLMSIFVFLIVIFDVIPMDKDLQLPWPLIPLIPISLCLFIYAIFHITFRKEKFINNNDPRKNLIEAIAKILLYCILMTFAVRFKGYDDAKKQTEYKTMQYEGASYAVMYETPKQLLLSPITVDKEKQAATINTKVYLTLENNKVAISSQFFKSVTINNSKK